MTRILVESDSAFRDSIAAIGACEIIIAAMRAHVKRAGTSDGDAIPAMSGCTAIHGSAQQTGPAVMDRLLTADAAGALLVAVSVYGYHKDTVHYASKTILSLCDHDGHRKALLEKGACDVLQSAQKSFPSLAFENVRLALAELSKR